MSSGQSEDPCASCSQLNSGKINPMSSAEQETFSTITKLKNNDIAPCSEVKSNRRRQIMRVDAKYKNDNNQENIPSFRRLYQYSQRSLLSSLEVIKEDFEESAIEHTGVEPFCTSMRQKVTFPDSEKKHSNIKVPKMEQMSEETCTLERRSSSTEEAEAVGESKAEVDHSKQDLTANRSSQLCRVCKINEEYDLRRIKCKSRPMSDIYPKVLIIEKNGKIHDDFENFENDLYLPLNESKNEQSIHSKMPKENMRNSEQPTLTEPDEHSRHISSEYTVEMELDTKSRKNQQLKAKNGQKQRQLELHQFKIAVEQKRLELLDLKLRREHDEMMRDQILFKKDLEVREKQLKRFTEDKKINENL